MTEQEKALIDAKREGWITNEICHSLRPMDAIHADAAKRFPYPPPSVWREAKDSIGNRYRRRDGVWEFLAAGEWMRSDYITDTFALALVRCVNEPTVQEGEVAP